ERVLIVLRQRWRPLLRVKHWLAIARVIICFVVIIVVAVIAARIIRIVGMPAIIRPVIGIIPVLAGIIWIALARTIVVTIIAPITWPVVGIVLRLLTVVIA